MMNNGYDQYVKTDNIGLVPWCQLHYKLSKHLENVMLEMSVLCQSSSNGIFQVSKETQFGAP